MENCENICRICLQSEFESSLEFAPIFVDSEIALNLFLVSSVKVVEPALICPICLKELFRCILFQKKCQSADEYFRARISNDESKNIKYEIYSGSPINDTELRSLELKTEDCLSLQFSESRDNADGFIENLNVDANKPAAKKNKLLKRKNSLQCRYCNITLSRRNRRIEHERLHLIDQNQPLFECNECGKSFNQKFGLIPHFKKFHNFKIGPTERWKCAICDGKILPPGNMKLHYEKHHSDIFCINNPKETLSCIDQMSKVVEIQKPIRLRKRCIKPKLPKNFWPCSICGNSFSNYLRYYRHLKEVHEVSDNQVIQDTAALENSVVINEALSIEKMKNKSANFPCTTCGKAFASIMTVRAHEKTHLDLEYTCDLCGSAFRVKAYLTAHVQKVHMKLKKFKCSIENCSASFVHRELLNYHVRKHLNIRNFSCRYCGKTFVTRSCCKIHERIHTDERPYCCKFCDRTFIHHSDHRRHRCRID